MLQILASVAVLGFVVVLGLPVVWKLRARLGVSAAIDILPLAFAAGTGIWALAAPAGYLLGLHLLAVSGLAVALSVLLLAIPARGEALPESNEPAPYRSASWAMLGLLGAGAATVGVHDNLSSDTVHHLIYLAGFGRDAVLSTDRFVLSATVPRDVLFGVYAGGSYHPLLALPGLLIANGAELAFRGGNGPGLVLVASALCLLARRLTVAVGTEKAAPLAGAIALALICLLFVQCGTRGYDEWSPRSFAYPNHIGAVPAIAAIVVLAGAMRPGAGFGPRLLGGLMLAGALGIHMQWFLFGAMFVALYGGLYALAERFRPAVLLSILWSAPMALVLAVLAALARIEPYMASATSIANAATVGAMPKFVRETAWGRIIDPAVLLCPNNLIAVVSALALIWLLWRSAAPDRHHAAAAFGPEAVPFAGAILVFALLLVTPVVTDKLMSLASPVVVGRMNLLLHAAGLAAAGAVLAALATRVPWITVRAPWLAGGLTAATLVTAWLAPLQGSARTVAAASARVVERGYPSLGQTLDDPAIAGVLGRIPHQARILLVQPAWMKQLPLVRTGARMVGTPYQLEPKSQALALRLSPLYSAETAPEAYARIVAELGIDAIVVWAWPEEVTDPVSGRPGFRLVATAAVDRASHPAAELRLYANSLSALEF